MSHPLKDDDSKSTNTPIKDNASIKTNSPLVQEVEEKILKAFISNNKISTNTLLHPLAVPSSGTNSSGFIQRGSEVDDYGHEDDGKLLPEMMLLRPSMHNHNDDDISILSQTSTAKKSIQFKDQDGIFKEEAENRILKAIEIAEGGGGNGEEQKPDLIKSDVLKGIHSDALHFFEDIINEDNEDDEGDDDIAGEDEDEDEDKKEENNFNDSDTVSSVKKTTPSVKFRFKSAANRAMMMKKLASTKEKTPTNEINNRIDENNLIGTANHIFGDSEKVQNQNDDDDDADTGAGTGTGGDGGDGGDGGLDNDIENQDKTVKDTGGAKEEDDDGKTRRRCFSRDDCYRYYCRPCYKFTSFLGMRKSSIMRFLKLFAYIQFFCVGIAALIYYIFTDPIDSATGASYSWYLLLVARFIVTFALAILAEIVVIDYLLLETKLALRSIGRFLTLMTAQAKGWPMWLLFWGIINFFLLFGDRPFARSWLYWVTTPTFMQTSTPHPTLLHSNTYRNTLICMVIIGLSTMIKRGAIVAVTGKKKFAMYGPQLESLMRKIFLVSQVAILAERIQYSSRNKHHMKKSLKGHPSNQWLFSHMHSSSYDKNDDYSNNDENDFEKNYLDMEENDNQEIITGANEKESKEIMDEGNCEADALLGGDWDEPGDSTSTLTDDDIIIKILEFREALDYLNGKNPLSSSFGLADTRKNCMRSAIIVFKHLLMKDPKSASVHFSTLSVVALDDEGRIKKEKARSLIRLFRPDRDGNIDMLSFVQACDNIYKDVKMFSATVINSTQLDDAIEAMANSFFYFFLSLIILSIMGMKLTGVLSFWTTVILPFAFLFKTAVSTWLEGVLLVLVREPFDIGDRIAISDPEKDTKSSGSTTWFVENFSMFSTTVRNAATNEVATYNNGYLAGLRIINAARSPKALVYVNLKFGMDISYEKVKIFHTVIENFVNGRPQEWLKLAAFRATAVEADLGYISYVLVLQHVESWQNVGVVLESKAEVSSFCLEVSKQMDMRFISPPMPVTISSDMFEQNLESEKALLSSDDKVGFLSNLFMKKVT